MNQDRLDLINNYHENGGTLSISKLEEDNISIEGLQNLIELQKAETMDKSKLLRTLQKLGGDVTEHQQSNNQQVMMSIQLQRQFKKYSDEIKDNVYISDMV